MKLIYCDEYLWKKIFLYKKKKILKKQKKILYSRSSNILKSFIGYYVYIYNGKKFKIRLINKWTVGFKFGFLTWNKKIAFYKAKQIKKKKK